MIDLFARAQTLTEEAPVTPNDSRPTTSEAINPPPSDNKLDVDKLVEMTGKTFEDCAKAYLEAGGLTEAYELLTKTPPVTQDVTPPKRGRRTKAEIQEQCDMVVEGIKSYYAEGVKLSLKDIEDAIKERKLQKHLDANQIYAEVSGNSPI